MERTGDIIDLAAFRKNEPPQLSIVDLLEQAEALIEMQRAMLNEFQSCASEREGSIDIVINSLQHLWRHMSLLKQLALQR